MICKCFPMFFVDEGHDASWGFGGAAVVFTGVLSLSSIINSCIDRSTLPGCVISHA